MSNQASALRAVSAVRAARASEKFTRYFPDCTDACDPTSMEVEDHVGMCRRLYPKHEAFFASQHRERLMIAANRIGKTQCGAFETTAHLTGQYPHWWTGRRFEEPVSWWAVGDTSKTVRDIGQLELMGPMSAIGSGFLPRHRIEHFSRKPGVTDAIETVWVKHVEREHGAPCLSELGLKSYDQRREAFQGTRKHGIWMDEEPPEDIYVECLLRTVQTSDFEGGLLMLTFTPLQGLTPLVLEFLPGGRLPEGEMPELAGEMWEGRDVDGFSDDWVEAATVRDDGD
jgi:phage terminase large subunit-like protein